jgi:flavin-dependent dehydrogenase
MHCVEAARAAGAEAREDFSVQEVLLDHDHVTGIRGRARRGTPVTKHARLIIGADGVHSLVAWTI